MPPRPDVLLTIVAGIASSLLCEGNALSEFGDDPSPSIWMHRTGVS